MGETGETGLDYPRMVREALRQVPRQALAEVAVRGLPPGHHFYLSFRTDAPGLELPAYLRERYPDEMTVVIQHQFEALEVSAEAFAVTLHFNGRAERVRVPFAALTVFVDPGAEVGFRFDAAEGNGVETQLGPRRVEDQGPATPGSQPGDSAAAEESSPPGDSDDDEPSTGRVVAFDRKRPDKPSNS